MLTLATAPFVFVCALLRDPTELAVEMTTSRSPARRSDSQVLQLPFRVFFPRAHEPPRR